MLWKTLRKDILSFIPKCEQEEVDKQWILDFMDAYPDALFRENSIAHFTASGWVCNKEKNKILMVYHNIYNSWSWTGGHADGEADLLAVALREVREETGVTIVTPVSPRIFSLEVLPVAGHKKNGKYVSSHLHLNLTYLLEVSEDEKLLIKPDENRGVDWITLSQIKEKVSEEWMMKWVYQKLLERMKE